jgi:plasmid maintenance system antidote protein VapI
METTITESSSRLTAFLDYLGVSANQFAGNIGLKGNSSIYHILNGRNEISEAFAYKVSNSYSNINTNWLLTGNGSMINNEEINKKNLTNPEPKGVPYYDIDFTASFLEVENNQTTLPDSYISHPFFKGCDYVVRSSGQSMAKVIAHGDAIGLVKIEKWFEFLPFGEIYAILTNDGFRMIKVITQGKNEDSYTLISKPTDSKKDEFPPQQIKKSSILSVFKVQAASHLF